MSGVSEPGPLEREVAELMRRRVAADPTIAGMVRDDLSDIDLEALGTNRSAKTDEMLARMIGGVKDAVERLAREIDAINSAPGGGNKQTNAD
jgi:hypothetical protein